MCIAAIKRLQAGFEIGYLVCPRCKGEHLDSENWALKYHSPHLCLSCDALFTAERRVIGNPLA
jgi:transposase-like protein